MKRKGKSFVAIFLALAMITMALPVSAKESSKKTDSSKNNYSSEQTKGNTSKSDKNNSDKNGSSAKKETTAYLDGELTGSDGIYSVTVTFDTDAQIPEGSTVSVTELSESDEAYQEAKEQVGPEDEEQFAALDISILDANGNEIEPASAVQVEIEVSGLSEGVDEDTEITVSHINESTGTPVAEAVADTADATDGVVTVTDESVVQAVFTVDSFSTFTIQWGSNTLEVRYGTASTNGPNVQISDLSGESTTISISSSSVAVADISAPSVSGYSYTGTAYIVTSSGRGQTTTQIYYLRYYSGSMQSGWQYSNSINGNTWQSVDSGTIYFIYSQDDSSGGYDTEVDASAYNGSAVVYWDESDFANSTAVSDDDTHVTGVTLGNQTIKEENSSSSGGWSGGTSLGACYPSASSNNMEDATLTISVEDGYYVSRVVIVCWPGTAGDNSSLTPYNCSTWTKGDAFDSLYEIEEDGSFSIDISSLYFSHTSNERNTSPVYFILIETTSIPTPLYVEYNYGAIETILGDDFEGSDFADADAWMTVSVYNVYAPSGSSVAISAGVQTADTQFKYMYNTNVSTESAASWKHYANTVTDDAKEAAAAAGYYFAGWYAEYYTDITVSDADRNDYNDYTYTFSSYLASTTYDENAQVYLYTNVKLTAIWLPIEVEVTKTVSGLTGTGVDDSIATYKMTLQKLETDANGNPVDETGSKVTDEDDYVWTDVTTVTIDVTGNGTETVTLKGTEYNTDGTVATSSSYVITPGTYRVVESEDSQGSRTVGTTVNYFSGVTYGNDTEVAVKDVTDGTTSYNLTVTNTYTDVAYFYVYHTCVAYAGKVEKISMSDVDKEKGYDITQWVDSNCLYGGYYYDYAGKGNYADDGVEVENDEDSYAYTGAENAWKRSDACTENGLSMTPVAGETYYLKEVPNYYLIPITYVVYDMNNNDTITQLYLMTAVDDDNYKSVGFDVTDKSGMSNNENEVVVAYDEDSDTMNVLNDDIKVVKKGSSADCDCGGTDFTVSKSEDDSDEVIEVVYHYHDTLTASGVFNEDNDEDGLQVGYLTISENLESYIATNAIYTQTPYFVTPDGCKVTSFQAQKVYLRNTTFMNWKLPGIFKVNQTAEVKITTASDV